MTNRPSRTPRRATLPGRTGGFGGRPGGGGFGGGGGLGGTTTVSSALVKLLEQDAVSYK